MVTDVRGREVTPRAANARFERSGSPTGVILSNGAALTVVLFHVLVDVHVGPYGPTSTEMAAILVAPPPSAAFPYQDLAHFGAVVVGGLASHALWEQLRRQGGRIHHGYLLATALWFFVVSRAVSVYVHFG